MRRNRPAVFKGRHFQDELIVVCVRPYLRYSLSYRDLEDLMAERGLEVDHSTIARWVLQYALILQQRLRSHVRQANRSWRVDETYVRVAARWTYLYRALDSEGNTIDFLLSPHRDRMAVKRFLPLALLRVGRLRPRVINVDEHPAYPSVISELKQTGELPKSCHCRCSPYMNNLIEQDHRFIKKRIVASQWFRSVKGAMNTIQGYEAIHMMHKGQIGWLPKGDVAGQIKFVNHLFGLTA